MACSCIPQLCFSRHITPSHLCISKPTLKIVTIQYSLYLMRVLYNIYVTPRCCSKIPVQCILITLRHQARDP